MLRYKLRTLLILSAVGPPLLALIALHAIELASVAVCLISVWLIATVLFFPTLRLEAPTT